MNIERLVERLDKGSKADDERDMVTPWRRRMVGGFGSIIYAYCCLSKLFRVGLYEWALLVGFFDLAHGYSAVQRLADRACPERSRRECPPHKGSSESRAR